MWKIPVLEFTDYTLPMIFTGVELHLLCNPSDILMKVIEREKRVA